MVEMSGGRLCLRRDWHGCPHFGIAFRGLWFFVPEDQGDRCLAAWERFGWDLSQF